jgi:hypothetical protein
MAVLLFLRSLALRGLYRRYLRLRRNADGVRPVAL